MNVCAVIPSLNPGDKLVPVAESLLAAGFKYIVIVDDGSDAAHSAPFAALEGKNGCIILRHERNMGKGRGLKTAFEYITKNLPDVAGVVTADDDGQHKPEDIKRCAEFMLASGDTLILGSRNFSLPDVPRKSRMGNKLTSFVFRTACGIKINDTQTGLRAIPLRFLDDFINIPGERFEYETNMLLHCKKADITVKEITISTVYTEGNRSSHFNPLVDSFKIYSLILKFLSSGFISAFADQGIFAVMMAFLPPASLALNARVYTSTFIARLFSSALNYTLNKRAVFGSDGKKTLVRYYILCAAQMCASALIVYLTADLLDWEGAAVTGIKIVADISLFFLSFCLQRDWVFKQTAEPGSNR